MSERRKYIIFNAGMWVAGFVAGAFLLFVLRGFGTALTARHEARALLEKARAQLDAGNVSDAQRSIVDALAVTPSVAPDVLSYFGEHLLGMPVLDERIREIFAAKKPTDDVLARYELLAGDPARALEALERYAADGGKEAEPYLWLGRLRADQGDFFAARDAFEAYWKASRSATGVGPNEWISRNANTGPPLERAWKLFRMGLWEHAPQVVANDVEQPERMFYLALALDMHEKPTEAMQLYTKLIRERPTHLPTLKRLRFLAGQ